MLILDNGPLVAYVVSQQVWSGMAQSEASDAGDSWIFTDWDSRTAGKIYTITLGKEAVALETRSWERVAVTVVRSLPIQGMRFSSIVNEVSHEPIHGLSENARQSHFLSL
jgi:hypothetical protein